MLFLLDGIITNFEGLSLDNFLAILYYYVVVAVNYYGHPFRRCDL
jgi:hypothetical protein